MRPTRTGSFTTGGFRVHYRVGTREASTDYDYKVVIETSHASGTDPRSGLPTGRDEE